MNVALQFDSSHGKIVGTDEDATLIREGLLTEDSTEQLGSADGTDKEEPGRSTTLTIVSPICCLRTNTTYTNEPVS